MNILIVSPHQDDDILGVGATIAKKVEEGHKVYSLVVTRPSKNRYSEQYMHEGREQYKAAISVLGCTPIFADLCGSPETDRCNIADINGCIERTVIEIKPECVYIPHWGDMHFEHRLVSEAALTAARAFKTSVKRVLAYETLSETGVGAPTGHNFFVPNAYEVSSEHYIDLKCEAMIMFRQQINYDYSSPRSVYAARALAKYRGSSIGRRYAEAFQIVREIEE